MAKADLDPRSTQISLNDAFKSEDRESVCFAVSAAIRTQKNLRALAKKAGVDRGTFYRSFRPNSDVKFGTLLKVMHALGFQLVVVANGERLETSVQTSLMLSQAFQTVDTAAISQACSEILRSQENVKIFADQANVWRETLYRAFTPRREPELATILAFLAALHLRLEVVPFHAGK